MKARVNELLEANALKDTKRILSWRSCLNRLNVVVAYQSTLFHTAATFLTAFGQWMHSSTITWIGIGANTFGVLLDVYKHMNEAMLKTLLEDLKKIRDGDYLDEENLLIGVEKAEKPEEHKTI
jgi:hypothetical protein